MATRLDLEDWIIEALKSKNGEASVLEVAKAIWLDHASELEKSGDLFYTWQYDMRWAAQRLRDKGKLKHQGRKWAL